MKKLQALFLVVMLSLASWGSANAMMQNGGGSGMGGAMMQNNGGFGMMNGMSGAPAVGADGTAYSVAMNPAAKPGTKPTSNSFQSTLTVITSSGAIITSLSFNGLMSKPVINGSTLMATTSLPNMNNYMMVVNGGTNSVSQQSVFYTMTLPISASSVPSAVSLDGSYASAPVMFNNQFYVITSDFGNAMMQGNNMYNNMYGKTNFSKMGASKSYLYIINSDLTIASKTLIQ
jgi:hypothetical protein